MGCFKYKRYYEDLKKQFRSRFMDKLDEYDHLWDKIEDLVKRNIVEESKNQNKYTNY